MNEQQMEEMQRGVFERLIKKKYPHLKNEWRDLFAEYYIEYLADNVRSINEFLLMDRLRPGRGLKPRFAKGVKTNE